MRKIIIALLLCLFMMPGVNATPRVLSDVETQELEYVVKLGQVDDEITKEFSYYINHTNLYTPTQVENKYRTQVMKYHEVLFSRKTFPLSNYYMQETYEGYKIHMDAVLGFYKKHNELEHFDITLAAFNLYVHDNLDKYRESIKEYDYRVRRLNAYIAGEID